MYDKIHYKLKKKKEKKKKKKEEALGRSQVSSLYLEVFRNI